MQLLKNVKAAMVGEKNGGSMKITVGPVIGNVATCSARILVEFSENGKADLRVKTGDVSVTVSREVKANRPQIFVFNNLKPGSQYRIKFQGKKIGSFKTISAESSSDLNFAIISCNSITVLNKQQPKKQMWTGLKALIEKGDIDYLVHIGDQVYIDYENWNGDKNNPYAVIEKKVAHLSVSERENFIEECREIVRADYRKTWSNEAIQFCLANAPSTMILDDHEIVDDCGRDQELQVPNSWKNWYSEKVARFVYYEYQKQLTMDVDFNSNFQSITHEFQQFVLKNTGFFLLDQRAHFLWHGDKWSSQNSMMGKLQREAFHSALSEDGLFKNCKSIFIINPVPLIMFTQRITKLGSYAVDDFKDHWMYAHKSQVIEVLDAMRNWQDAKAGRVVTLAGGDVHFGGHYDIYYKKKPCFKQFVASSMGQYIMPLYAKFISELSSEMGEEINEDYGFIKHSFVYENNFGLVNINDDADGHLVEMKLITNKYQPIKADITWNNRKFFKNFKSENCSIF